MNPTSISWTDKSSNPLRAKRFTDGKTGWACSKVSDGCTNCYSEAINMRYGTRYLFNEAYIPKIDWVLDKREFKAWKKLSKPSKIFLEDMSDLFHEDIPDDFRHQVFQGIASAPQHIYQILTKRPDKMRDYFKQFPEELLENMWLGTSVENKKVFHRVETLRQIKASVRFLSVEPLLESLKPLNIYNRIHWIIVGAESGNHRRAYDEEWAREIRDECLKRGIAFWYKQGSHRFSGRNDKLDGKKWHEFPKTSRTSRRILRAN